MKNPQTAGKERRIHQAQMTSESSHKETGSVIFHSRSIVFTLEFLHKQIRRCRISRRRHGATFPLTPASKGRSARPLVTSRHKRIQVPPPITVHIFEISFLLTERQPNSICAPHPARFSDSSDILKVAYIIIAAIYNSATAVNVSGSQSFTKQGFSGFFCFVTSTDRTKSDPVSARFF